MFSMMFCTRSGWTTVVANAQEQRSGVALTFQCISGGDRDQNWQIQVCLYCTVLCVLGWNRASPFFWRASFFALILRATHNFQNANNYLAVVLPLFLSAFLLRWRIRVYNLRCGLKTLNTNRLKRYYMFRRWVRIEFGAVCVGHCEVASTFTLTKHYSHKRSLSPDVKRK